MKRVAWSLGLMTFCFAAPVFAQQQQCTTPKTMCAGAGGYYASREDLDRLTAVSDPILKELRTCLDGAGAKQVQPAISIRWDSDGNPVSVKLEVPGYETLPCVAKASAKLTTLQNPHETSIRCEYGCPKPAAPLPPVVVGPPQQQQQPQQQQLSQQQQPREVAPPPPRVPDPPRYESKWYGWQILIADAVAYPLTLAGVLSEAPGVAAIGTASYVLASPVIHFVHSNVGKGFGAMGMRIGAPLVGALFGLIVGLSDSQASNENKVLGDDDPAGKGALIGAFVGAGVATLIDVLVFAKKKERVDGDDISKTHFHFTPMIDARRGMAGVGGTF